MVITVVVLDSSLVLVLFVATGLVGRDRDQCCDRCAVSVVGTIVPCLTRMPKWYQDETKERRCRA